MAFGKHKSHDDVDGTVDLTGDPVDEQLDGPFDVDDFDDPSAAALGRLDLGSVLIPMPEAGQVQVELSEVGVPSAVWVVTPNGRFTGTVPAIAAALGVSEKDVRERLSSLMALSFQDAPMDCGQRMAVTGVLLALKGDAGAATASTQKYPGPSPAMTRTGLASENELK